MHGRRAFLLFIRIVLLSVLLVYSVLPGPVWAISGITAKAALVRRLDSDIVIFSQSRDLRLRAASTVKVLSAVIAIERLDLDQDVVISKRAAGIAPSKAYLTQGATYKVRDLLKAFLMSSANDAGVALAEAVAGTEIQFAELMNERARQLDAKDSLFLNATGLPEGKRKQYSTVHDLALFMKKLSTFPFLGEVISTKQDVICGSDGKKIYLKNHNKMLGKEGNTLVGKTGYTIAARHCFLGMFSQGKHRYIVALQGSAKPWADLATLMRKTGKPVSAKKKSGE